MRTPTFSVEVIRLPVSDVERALRFYVDQVGFTLDVDYRPNDAFRVVQLTPPGSTCSIQIGNGLTDAPVRSLRNVYLVVTDLEASRSRLLERGVEVGEIRHKTPIGTWDGGFAPGLDPARGDYASFADFSDPDGNSRVLQEGGYWNVTYCRSFATSTIRRSRNTNHLPKEAQCVRRFYRLLLFRSYCSLFSSYTLPLWPESRCPTPHRLGAQIWCLMA